MKARRNLFALLAASLFVVPYAAAQTDSFTLTHGGWTYEERDLDGDGDRDGGGTADFINPLGQDNMFQNWWWYNTGFTGRENALGSLVSLTQTSASSARLVFVEDGGPNSPDSLLFDLEYTLTALPGGTSALVSIAWKVHNLSNEAQTVNLFSYTDFDLNEDAGNDTGVFIMPNQFSITDGNPLVRGGLVASNSGQSGWEQAFFDSTLDKLTDGDVDTLANATSPLGPGDLTHGFSWSFTLAANGASNGGDQMVGSLVKYVNNPVPEPASFAALLVGGAAMLARRRRR